MRIAIRYLIAALIAAIALSFSPTAMSDGAGFTEPTQEDAAKFQGAAKACQERALFAGQVVAARDRGLSLDEVEHRVKATMEDMLKNQPVMAATLGIYPEDLPAMLGTIRIVWTWKCDRDEAVGRYFEQCLTDPDV